MKTETKRSKRDWNSSIKEQTMGPHWRNSLKLAIKTNIVSCQKIDKTSGTIFHFS